ncbi:T9SS type A sorting domain-containing protein [Candidatus Latescibacterota bacterium]
MKRSASILCVIILLISYSTIKTSGNSESIASDSTVRIFGVVTDSTGVAIPNATVKFTSSDKTISAFSDESGLYSALLPNDPTRVESSMPESFTLHQNYPNPFNPSTVIQYSLDESSSVHLDIFSATGQHVMSLARGTENAGMHSVVWDGRDKACIGVAAGVYLYRLRSGNEIQTKKMVLVDGAVSNSGFSGKISTPIIKTASDSVSEIEYVVTAEKSTMIASRDTVSVSFEPSEMELNVVLQDRYLPYVVFFNSNNYNHEFIYPEESITLALGRIHEVELPEEFTVTLSSGAGDSETITLTGSSDCSRKKLSFCQSIWYYTGCRTGNIVSSSDSPIQNNGIIEVDAHADTVIATYALTPGVSSTASIAVVDSVETIILWGRTYFHWGEEWYIAADLTGDWWRTEDDSCDIRFSPSTTEDEISDFIQIHDLQIGYQFNEYYYIFRMNGSLHPVEFIQGLKENSIIEEAGVYGVICAT